MVFEEFPIPLTIYDDISKQNRYKENIVNQDLFKLWALSNRILPFQFREVAGAVLSSISINRVDLESLPILIPVNNILSELVSGYQYFTWLSNTDLESITLVSCAEYYLRFTFTDPNLPEYYSEIFSIMADPSKYFLLEWDNQVGDIDPVYYGSGYKNRLFSDTFITKGIPNIEIDQESDGYGNIVPWSKKMINNYDFSLLIAPNFIIDAINFMSIHDNIVINTKQNVRNGKIQNVIIENEQLNTQALWEVTVKFNQDQFFYNGACPTPIKPAPPVPGPPTFIYSMTKSANPTVDIALIPTVNGNNIGNIFGTSSGEWSISAGDVFKVRLIHNVDTIPWPGSSSQTKANIIIKANGSVIYNSGDLTNKNEPELYEKEFVIQAGVDYELIATSSSTSTAYFALDLTIVNNSSIPLATDTVPIRFTLYDNTDGLFILNTGQYINPQPNVGFNALANADKIKLKTSNDSSISVKVTVTNGFGFSAVYNVDAGTAPFLDNLPKTSLTIIYEDATPDDEYAEIGYVTEGYTI